MFGQITLDRFSLRCYGWAIYIIFHFFHITNGQTDGQTDGWTDGRKDGWKNRLKDRQDDGHFQRRI